MDRVVAIRVLPGFEIEAEFDDGVKGVVALGDRLVGPMFEPLRDPAVFAQACIDEWGVICWPNGADLAPDALHDALKKKISESGKA